MPSRNQSGKPEHIHQNLGRKRPKSGKKLEKSIKTYVRLLEREKKEGETKWIKNAKAIAKARLDKFGIIETQVDAYIESKNK